ncbi:hypothetical protein F2Q70_00042897 [Brassica cretica]|uniref:Uncharacterized protein n=1 Tax=Brassica cretica TaxID=69181 RepID=A0A8S9KMP4_BRACR|nr:hypothetical protein F2Q70_00042897 [Brassica cretica]
MGYLEGVRLHQRGRSWVFWRRRMKEGEKGGGGNMIRPVVGHDNRWCGEAGGKLLTVRRPIAQSRRGSGSSADGHDPGHLLPVDYKLPELTTGGPFTRNNHAVLGHGERWMNWVSASEMRAENGKRRREEDEIDFFINM